MTLYVVQTRGDDASALDRAVLVKDGFSWGAFVFAPLWLLWHRLWLAVVTWIALEALYFALARPHLSVASAVLVGVIAHLYIGGDGNRLRLAKAGKGATRVSVIAARDTDEAERRFFDACAGAGDPIVRPMEPVL